MMRLFVYVLFVSALWAVLVLVAREAAEASMILFIAAIVVPGTIVEVRDLLGRHKQ